MCALYVVGVDLELWLGVDLGISRKQQVLVLLFCIGVLGILANNDAPTEHGAGATIEHTLVELTARAAGLRMIEKSMIVYMLASTDCVEAIEDARAALGCEGAMDRIAHQDSAESDVVGSEQGVRILPDVQAAYMKRLRAFQPELVVFDSGVVGHGNFGNRVGEITRLA